MLLQEILTRTRLDWQAFDNARATAFELTAEEKAQIEKNRLQSMVDVTKQYLLLYGILFNGDELDLRGLYELYIKGDGSESNSPMYEWLGDDTRLDEILAYRIEYHNNIKDFCQFILSYEQ